jgi:hypothetical protein
MTKILTEGESLGFGMSLGALIVAIVSYISGASILWPIFLTVGGLGMMITGFHILKNPLQDVKDEQ